MLSFSVRSLLPTEARMASQFLENFADGHFGYPAISCHQHADTIFVCVGPAGEWAGLLVSYKSPRSYNRAVVEGAAVHHDFRRQGAARKLIEYATQYWLGQGVFQLAFMSPQFDVAVKTWLEKSGFAFAVEEGLELYKKRLQPQKIWMHNRCMRPRMNTINGEVGEETLFQYFQQGQTVWGLYAGGDVQQGVLLGKMTANGDIDFNYMQVNQQGEMYSGASHAATEFLNDGRIIMYEDWAWTGNRSGEGHCVNEEIKD